jgi:hypothetical protein
MKLMLTIGAWELVFLGSFEMQATAALTLPFSVKVQGFDVGPGLGKPRRPMTASFPK